MTTVANSTGVFATLQYSFDDPNGAVQIFSANTQAHLNTMPAFIESWQAQDIANNDVGGYLPEHFLTALALRAGDSILDGGNVITDYSVIVMTDDSAVKALGLY
jgi:hypothetical protein